MQQTQKEVILSQIKDTQERRGFTNHFLIPYPDFLDLQDSFTAFQCERSTGKQAYQSLLNALVCADKSAQAFVEVYGYEEEKDDIFIYADTFFILSKLCLYEIKKIFDVPEIFPSDVGEIKELSESNTVICSNGTKCPVTDWMHQNHSAYYCWWD